MAWIDDFEKRLNTLVAAHAASAQNNPQNLALQYIQGLNKLYTAQGPYNGPSGGSPTGVKHSLGSILKGAGSASLWAIDKVERPLEGLAAGFKQAETNANIGDLSKNISEGHTGKALLEELKPAYEIFRHPVDEAKAFAKGFSGDQKAASNLAQPLGSNNKAVNAVSDLGFGLTADPLNFAGTPAKAGVAFLKGLKGAKAAKSTVQAVTEAAPEVANVASTAPKTAQDFLSGLSTDKVPPELSREIHVGPAGDTNVRTVRALSGPPSSVITGRALLSKYDDLLGKIPTKRLGKSNAIAPNWTDVTEEIPSKVTPKTAPVRTAKGLSDEEASTVATLQHMLTHPDTTRIPITLGGRQTQVTVEQLQKLAREGSPEKAKMVGQIIKNRAAELAKTGVENGTVRFSTKAGQFIGEPGTGVSIDSLRNLLRTGSVPASAVKEGPLEQVVSQYALHSKEDLDKLFLRQISGGHISVGDYLKQLGVKVSPVKSSAERLTEALTQKAPVGKTPFKFDFEKEAAPATETVTKRIGLTKAQRAEWVKNHDFLSPDEQKRLLASRSATEFQKKVAEITGNSGAPVKSMDELVAAVEDGRVDPKDLDKLLSATGGKSVKGAKQAYDRVVSALAKAEHTMFNPQAVTAETVSRNEIGKNLAESVKPADEIVDEVSKTGSSPVLSSPTQALDSSQEALLKESLIHGVAKNFIEPQDLEKYGFTTNTGVKRTAGTINKGYGRKLQSWNKYAQLNAFRSLVSPKINALVKDTIEKSGADLKKMGAVNKRFATNSIKYDYIMPILRAQEKILKDSGIPAVLGDGVTGPALSIVDILDTLPKAFVTSTVFDGTKSAQSIFFTQFSDIAEKIIAHGQGKLTEPELRQAIADDLRAPLSSRSLIGKDPIISGMAKSIENAAKRDPVAANDILNKAVQTFIDAAPEIVQKFEANTAEYAMHFGAAVPQISNEVLQNVSKMFLDPKYTPGDLVEVSNKIDNLARISAKQLGINDPFAVETATKAAQIKAAQIIPPRMQAEDRAAHAFTAAEMGNIGQALKESNIAAVGAKQAKNDLAAVEGLVDIKDIDQAQELPLIFRGLMGFSPSIGNKELHPLLVEGNSATQYIATRTSKALSDISKNNTPEDLMAAWHQIQQGTVPVEDATLNAFNQLKPVVSSIFDGSPDNFFARNGVTLPQLNKWLDKYKIPGKYAMENPDSWREWDTTDPLQLLSKYHAAAQAAFNERMMANHIVSEYGSQVAKPGWVKITGRGPLPHLIGNTTYFPKEIASEFATVNKALMEAAAGQTSNTFVKVYDSTLHSLKAGFTIYRAGHHIRNMVSDMFFSWAAGVNNPTVYKDALKVMSANKGQYNDFDAVRALQEMGVTGTTDPTKALIHTKVAGKSVALTPQDVWRLAVQHGIITDYHTIEDISDTSLSAVLARKSPFKGKIHRAATSVSESREYLARLPHFIDVLKKGSFTSLDEAGRKAGNVVRKWHPDGSDLGTAEKKYARRVILFYSWMRKAIPLAIESAVYNPAKVLAYPKAYYAIAQANGLDLNGFGDPYPSDKIFPDWITSNITGPLLNAGGSDFAISPGIPTDDIANQFGTNPKQAAMQIAGATNPALRVPLEILYGHQAGTGAPIKDKTDYADSQIPLASTLSSLTNRSASSGFTQPVHSVASGAEPGGFDWTAFANWLTGLGITNQSRYARGG